MGKKNRKRRRPPPEEVPAAIEIRNRADGRLDEIFASGAEVHLEQMDSGFWWMGLEVEGRRFHINFVSAKGIRVTVDEEEPDLEPRPAQGFRK
jgi:archaeosine-15-forming tRNA-guanine transglycosylase